MNLWDCGGQDQFFKEYFESQKTKIFSDVSFLIYVIDISSTKQEKENNYFRDCLSMLKQQSPESKIYVLINKMDIFKREFRNTEFEKRKASLEN